MDVAKTCRVCLSGGAELTPLRIKLPSKDKTLEETINFVANINIVLENGLPDKICKDCGTMLDVADIFKRRCLGSETILGQINKGTDESRHEENSRKSYVLQSEDTPCFPTVLPCPLLEDSLGEIKTEENIYDYPEYKIKIEIDENYAYKGRTANEQEQLDVKSTQVEQLLPKQDCSEIKESITDKTNKDNTQNTPKRLKLLDMETGCATENEKQSKCIENTAVNTGGKIFICRICKYSIVGMKSLQSHLKLHADSATKQYFCKTCSYSTTNLSGYKYHQMTHTDDEPYKCNVCAKKFILNQALVVHMRTHTGEKPYTCDVCQKSFSEKQTLVVHMRTHTGEKPYTCHVCEKSFCAKQTLVVHKRTHTGARSYTCDLCEKKFIQKIDLVAHQRILHIRPKPYACHVCKKSFIRQYNLVAHMKIRHEPYSCSVCEKNFSRKSHLDTHKRTHEEYRHMHY